MKVRVYTNHIVLKFFLAKNDVKPRIIRWIILLQEFDLEIRDKKGTKNVVVNHLSRLELEKGEKEDGIPINDTFPDEYLMAIQAIQKEPCYVDILNFLTSNFYL